MFAALKNRNITCTTVERKASTYRTSVTSANKFTLFPYHLTDFTPVILIATFTKNFEMRCMGAFIDLIEFMSQLNDTQGMTANRDFYQNQSKTSDQHC
ncbi:uncharacterized protein PHALS_14628 [Plasmopara halstedii]|uniref:Uncharacterized protein n=1 Tax=Plasmopara halstedii TaxID=4781 RepID=A0A0P1AMT6_PLAHL|nr:uncharacterized protein PHALS_14628 [Plasmopara halstedii]CEG42469.1 hypothetical protein PHALS_14628 [Plasmopara halstedii]|eukprot:XP_024578838.1 hypothetical protein PHALS_14628 [Plasmopara halstedii]